MGFMDRQTAFSQRGTSREIKREYERWRSHRIDDKDLIQELAEIEKKNKEIYERFYTSLSFGTAGLRGILGAGSNRMNIYTVGQATQGLANYLNNHYERPFVAIAYDSRRKSREFARMPPRYWWATASPSGCTQISCPPPAFPSPFAISGATRGSTSPPATIPPSTTVQCVRPRWLPDHRGGG